MAMKLSEQEVRELARVSRVALAEEELPWMTRDLNALIADLAPVLDYVPQGEGAASEAPCEPIRNEGVCGL